MFWERRGFMNDELKAVVAEMSREEKLELAIEFEREALILRCEVCGGCEKQPPILPCRSSRIWLN